MLFGLFTGPVCHVPPPRVVARDAVRESDEEDLDDEELQLELELELDVLDGVLLLLGGVLLLDVVFDVLVAIIVFLSFIFYTL